MEFERDCRDIFEEISGKIPKDSLEEFINGILKKFPKEIFKGWYVEIASGGIHRKYIF